MFRRRRYRPEGVEAITGIGQTDPVPDRFPFLLDDNELDATLRDMIAAIPGFDQYRALLPELKLTLIQIGSQERSRRESDRFARRSLWVALIALAVSVAALATSLVLALSDDSGASKADVVRLDSRAAQLEQKGAALSAAQASDRERFQAATNGLYSNDEALYTGVAMAQHGVVCNQSPACHVPLGMPGAVYKEDGKPNRIFATPFP